MREHFAGKKHIWDLCLILGLLLIAGLLYLLLTAGGKSGAWAVVRVNGEEIARYSLKENGEYPLNGGTNTLVIMDGQAWLVDANCPDKLCVKQGKIKYDNQCITCLPNRLTVTLVGAEKGGVELVS